MIFSIFIENNYVFKIYFSGWIGYSDEVLEELCQKYLDEGYTAFKVKVGKSIDDDIKRLRRVRNIIGYDKKLVCFNSIIS